MCIRDRVWTAKCADTGMLRRMRAVVQTNVWGGQTVKSQILDMRCVRTQLKPERFWCPCKKSTFFLILYTSMMLHITRNIVIHLYWKTYLYFLEFFWVIDTWRDHLVRLAALVVNDLIYDLKSCLLYTSRCV